MSNYANLTPKERISKAAEYASILIEEGKLRSQIISELMMTFSMSQYEAEQAFEKLKSENSVHYKKSMNANIFKTLLLVIALAGAAAIYFFASLESSKLLIVLAIVFGGSVILGCVYIVKALFERFNFRLPDISAYIPSQKNGKLSFLTNFLLITSFLLSIAFYSEITESGTVDESSICIIDNLVLSSEVTKGSTGSKSKSYFLLFTVGKYPSKGRFFDKYYKYSEQRISVNDFKKGDTIDIQINKKDSADFVSIYRYDPEIFDIVNVRFGNHFLIDHKKRNRLEKEKNIWNRNVALTLFCISVLAFIIIPILKRKGFISN